MYPIYKHKKILDSRDIDFKSLSLNTNPEAIHLLKQNIDKIGFIYHII